MYQALSIASGVVTLIALVPYIRSILLGQTRPNRATWWIWLSVNILLASTYYATGSKAGLWLGICSIAGQAIVAILSIRRGTGGATPLDLACLAGAIGVAILWYFSSSPLLPHYLTVAIDFCGWVPTFAKSLRDPRSENNFSWGLWALGGLLAVLAIETWNVPEAAFPLYILISDGIVFVLTSRKVDDGKALRRRS